MNYLFEYITNRKSSLRNINILYVGKTISCFEQNIISGNVMVILFNDGKRYFGDPSENYFYGFDEKNQGFEITKEEFHNIWNGHTNKK
jgi:hypothetical protein